METLEKTGTGSRRLPKPAWTICAKRIGVPITDTVEPWNYEATRERDPSLCPRHRR